MNMPSMRNMPPMSMIPSSPASVGVYHAVAVLALAVTGTPQELALAVALISHALIFVMHVTFGALALGTLGGAVRRSIKSGSWKQSAERT